MSEGPPAVILDAASFSTSFSQGFFSEPILFVEWLAVFAFFGTIIFCAVQAAVAPRKTFCAEGKARDD